jgi:hypothetical protein
MAASKHNNQVTSRGQRGEALQISHGCLQTQQPSHVPIPDTPKEINSCYCYSLFFAKRCYCYFYNNASDLPVAALPCSTSSVATQKWQINTAVLWWISGFRSPPQKQTPAAAFGRRKAPSPAQIMERVANMNGSTIAHVILDYFCSLRHSPKGVAAFGLFCF